MVKYRAMFRTIFGFFLSVLASLILFGITLALSWRLAPSSPASKLIGLYFSYGLAMLAGGYIFAWQGRIEKLVLPALSGFFLGGCSAVYILGPTLPALGLACGTAFIAAFGALLNHKLVSGRSSANWV